MYMHTYIRTYTHTHLRTRLPVHAYQHACTKNTSTPIIRVGQEQDGSITNERQTCPTERGKGHTSVVTNDLIEDCAVLGSTRCVTHGYKPGKPLYYATRGNYNVCEHNLILCRSLSTSISIVVSISLPL